MVSHREGSPRGRQGRRLALWAGLAVGWVLPSVGCQVEYAGMTLPSGKYMYDDVQYFPPGPDFPWANTQAATQRARMQAMGLDVPSSVPTGPIGAPQRPPGTLDPTQNIPGMPTNVNVLRRPAAEEAEGVLPAPVPPPPPPGVVPPPGGIPPAPPAPGDVAPGNP